ncbi:MAG: VCBS repeat-containing protein [Planctomycetes bacterium]|nr:VCBS repeat-containing protein [Planctomycetota bacterium]
MIITSLLIALQQSSFNGGGEWFVEQQNLLTSGPISLIYAWENLGDADGDGGEEIVMALPGIGDSEIVRIDSGIGGEAWRVSWHGLHPQAVYSLPEWIERLDDVNGDGVSDLLIGSRAPISTGIAALLSGADGSTLWVEAMTGSHESFGDSGCRVGDIDSDGVNDFLILAHLNHALFSPELFAYSGATRAILWSMDTYSKGWGWGSVVCDLDGVDYDGDGCEDFLLQSGGLLRIISSVTGNQILSLGSAGGIFIKNGSKVTAVGDDLDGDGLPDIVVEHPNFPLSQKICIGTSAAQTIWTQVDSEPYSSGTVSLPDIDGDGYKDFAVGAPDLASGGSWNGGKVALLSGLTGAHIRYIRGGDRNTEGVKLGEFIAASVDGSPKILASQLLGPSASDASTMQFAFDPYISTSAHEVSASGPVSVDLSLSFPVEFANHSYGALFSWSGYGPTDLFGLKVPLTWDSLMQKSVQNSLPSAIQFARGSLDAAGNVVVEIRVPTGILTSVVGRRLHAVAVVADLGLTTLVESSAGMGILIEP